MGKPADRGGVPAEQEVRLALPAWADPGRTAVLMATRSLNARRPSWSYATVNRLLRTRPARPAGRSFDSAPGLREPVLNWPRPVGLCIIFSGERRAGAKRTQRQLEARTHFPGSTGLGRRWVRVSFSPPSLGSQDGEGARPRRQAPLGPGPGRAPRPAHRCAHAPRRGNAPPPRGLRAVAQPWHFIWSLSV